MKITIAPRGILQIDDARIIYRNFSGTPSKFNREGDRNFAVVIPSEEITNELREEGWNVREKPARDYGDEPLRFIPVKIKISERGPIVYVKTGSNMNKLDAGDMGMIDKIDIVGADLDIRPYDWNVNGKTGRTAYLQSICVHQDVDRFAVRYGNEEVPF